MDNVKEERVIDVPALLKKMWDHKRPFFISVPIAAALAVFIVLCIPRYYTCEVKLAPEQNSVGSAGSIGALATQFGLDLSSGLGEDAISPDIYPDLMQSRDFQVALFPVKIVTDDGKIKTDYYTYMSKMQKSPWWSSCISAVRKLFKSKDSTAEQGGKVNSFRLTKEQTDVANAIGGNVTCRVDKKTDIISIVTTAQDPLVCATLAEAVADKLKKFIVDYRTKKARTDLENLLPLEREAQQKYEKAREAYANYSDANQDAVLLRYRSKMEDMENRMQLLYNSYSALTVQVQAAQAKLREKTPVFTTIQNATVPLKPAGPKRMITVIAVVLLTFILTAVYVINKDYSQIK